MYSALTMVMYGQGLLYTFKYYVNLIRNYGDNFICSWKKAGSDYKETLDLCYKKAVTDTVGSMQ